MRTGWPRGCASAGEAIMSDAKTMAAAPTSRSLVARSLAHRVLPFRAFALPFLVTSARRLAEPPYPEPMYSRRRISSSAR